MELVIFDLEWNSGYCKKTGKFINEIIELGAVKLNEQMEQIGQFSIFVRPEITRRPNPKVRELTQLTNEDLIHGATFSYAISKFRKFTSGCVISSWSTSDLSSLEANCEYYNRSPKIPFLERYADVQEYCQDMIGSVKNQLALQGAAELLGIDSDDIPLHRAVGDSILTARILRKLYDPEKFASYVKTVDDEFYARLNFKTTFIYDINNPLINRDELFMLCGECGTRCEASDGWKSRNKAFYADLICPSCGKKTRGRIQFKLCYDGLTVIKRTIAEPSEKTDEKAEDPDTDTEEMGYQACLNASDR